jgi:phosphatidate cytidylyltransferase
VIISQLEIAGLGRLNNIKIFTPLAITASALFSLTWYLCQFLNIPKGMYVSVLSAMTLLSLFVYQYFSFGTKSVMVNCGSNIFAIMYIGILSSFAVGIRISFGVWPLLMCVFVVKCTDIGAYTFGSLFGRHKFSPGISPNKTWEGMAGGVLLATIAAILFATMCGIMDLPLAILFGVCFAFIGQLGDLAESMLKRDAELKDSASKVPGYGGILDVIDSPLVAGVFAYLYFMLTVS